MAFKHSIASELTETPRKRGPKPKAEEAAATLAKRPVGRPPKRDAVAANVDEESWGIIKELALKKNIQKVKLGDCINSRDAYQEQLREMGRKRSTERDDLCVGLVDELTKIDSARARFKDLDAQLDKAINDVAKGQMISRDLTPKVGYGEPEDRSVDGSDLNDPDQAVFLEKSDKTPWTPTLNTAPIGRVGVTP